MDQGQIRAKTVCGPVAPSHSWRGPRHHAVWASPPRRDGAQPSQAAAPAGPLHQGGHQRPPQPVRLLQGPLSTAAARLRPACRLSAGGRGDDAAPPLGGFYLTMPLAKQCERVNESS